MQPNDKQVLAESMRKLISTISNNKSQQLKIFDSLSKDDIIKIFQNFQHSDSDIRKMSAKLISELLFNNNHIKEKLIHLLTIFPTNGNIILNKIPECFKDHPERILNVTRFLKNNTMEHNKILPHADNNTLCWYVDPESQIISVNYVSLNSFPLNQFIDPNKCIFGITFQQTLRFKSTLENHPISTTPPLSFKSAQYSPLAANKYYTKTAQNYQKQRLTFTSRQKWNNNLYANNSLVDKIERNEADKKQEISFKNHNISSHTDKIVDKIRLSSSITDRERPITSKLNYSIGSKPKDYDEKRKQKHGIQITSPTSLMNTSHQLKQDNSEEKHVIVLGGKTAPRQLTNSTNYTKSHQPNQYTFSSRPPIVSNPISSNNVRTPSARLEYMKQISNIRTPREQGETKIYSEYKPSNHFLRKLKDSVKSYD